MSHMTTSAKGKKKPGRSAAGKKAPGTAIVHSGPVLDPGEYPREDALPSSVWKHMKECSPQEQQFVVAYAGRARGNATLAAQMAGIGGSYSAQSSRASTMLRIPRIRSALDAWLEAFCMSAAQLTGQIVDMCQVNMGPFIQRLKDGTLKVRVPSDEAWEAHKHWIKGITCDPRSGQVIDVQLHDAAAARRDLAKIMKLYSDAPIITLQMQMSRMTDEEILRLASDDDAVDDGLGIPMAPRLPS